LKSIRFSLFIVLLLSSTLTATAFAAPGCTGITGTTCDGHKHLDGTNYPFTEDFANFDRVVTAGAGHTVVIEGCPERSYVNFTHSNTIHAVLRTSLELKSATAPAGSRVSVQFKIDGTAYAGHIRTLNGQYPQREEINSVVQLAPGAHRISVTVHLIDGPGSVTIGRYSFLSAQGAPTATGAGSSAIGTTITVDGTWKQISGPITIYPTTDVNLLVQGYVQVNSGTPGQQLSFGFSLDGASSQRTIDVAVPAYFPSGINLFDHYKYKPTFLNVPSGTHTISLWAINRDGGSTVLQYRQTEAIGFEALNDSETLMLEAQNTTAKVVTSAGDGTVTYDPLLVPGGCGQWTNLLEYQWTYPANHPTYPNQTYPHYPAMNAPASTNGQNWVGEAYLEFMGNGQTWQHVQVAIEVINDPTYDANKKLNGAGPTADFTIVDFKIPPGRSQKFVFTHALLWGAAKANHIRLLVRPINCGGGSGTFTVGKRYMAIKTIPTTGATFCHFD
jgi:hypothetical protein